ncbi:MAG TPA: isocitrate/isopropylmalate family dehydrogenase [Candidatus Polarisedimenticolaceae bacterium]|nr:isocitrate/isopropylmalate family dehydrogenase [Candidatus Polarisedimenticolaceae bacterium]
MSRRVVVTMPGDGIGRVVLPHAVAVLEAAGFDADYVEAPIGWDCWLEQGNALPQRTVELLERHRLGLFGAITSKAKTQAEAELRPELRRHGLRYTSPIVALRQRFDLDVCIRPCRSFPGNPLNFVRRTASGAIEEPSIDAVVFRQNTEGLYVGLEWTDPPAAVLDALGSHPRFRPFAGVPPADIAITTRLFTRNACRRIVHAAYDYALRHGRASVTVCEKPNVLQETSGMLEQVAREVQSSFPAIEHRAVNIDTQMLVLTKMPETLGVIVAGNEFGDILSDGIAGLVGGLGFVASANLGERIAVFEPIHGSAPKYASVDPPIANPIAMILAAAMLAEYAGDAPRAATIRQAVARVVRAGRVRTYDMLRVPGGADVRSSGAATTGEMAQAVIAELEPLRQVAD